MAAVCVPFHVNARSCMYGMSPKHTHAMGYVVCNMGCFLMQKASLLCGEEDEFVVEIVWKASVKKSVRNESIKKESDK